MFRRLLLVLVVALVSVPSLAFAGGGDVIVRRGLFGRRSVVVRNTGNVVVRQGLFGRRSVVVNRGVAAVQVVPSNVVLVNRFALGNAVIVNRHAVTVAQPVVIQNAFGLGGVTVLRGGCGSVIAR